jgi:DNA-binding NtrC family response regulator
MANVLVVDDEPDIRNLVKEILEDEGFNVSVAENGEKARSLYESTHPDLILLDIWMPDIDGITLLTEWKKTEQFDTPVVMMSGHGTVETAVEATREGAYDFIEKPLSLAKLLLTVKHAVDTKTLQHENVHLRQHSWTNTEPIGKSQQIIDLKEQIKRIASHNTQVLIQGEPGTDKELYARYLHSLSERQNGPFIVANVSALSYNDAGSELFGREENGNSYPGFFDKALEGTLFLKDIADMDITLQAKFQNTIDKKSYMHVGGADPIEMDMRIIAATRCKLETQVQTGKFRDELLYQLNIVPIKIPPLREHFEDVPELLDYYINYFVDTEGLAYRHFSVAAQNRLRSYAWPGNVRELKNLVQRLLILGSGETIELDEIETTLGKQTTSGTLDATLDFDLPLREARERFEKAYLEFQLAKANGSVSKVARNAGMERTHLYRKLKALGIELK